MRKKFVLRVQSCNEMFKVQTLLTFLSKVFFDDLDYNKFHVHQCQAQSNFEISHSPDLHLISSSSFDLPVSLV